MSELLTKISRLEDRARQMEALAAEVISTMKLNTAERDNIRGRTPNGHVYLISTIKAWEERLDEIRRTTA